MLAVPTACPFCSCGCGLYLLTRDGRPVGVAPSESHPISGGKLCARGWSAHEATLWGNRVTQPLLNRNGKKEPVSWNEALDHVAERFKEFVTAGKLIGVLGSARATNEENYLASRLARAGLHSNNIDFSYRSVVGPLLAGVQQVCGGLAPSIRLSEIADSQAVFLVEGNLAETHPRAASQVLRALENGAHLITVGYRRTQMARLAELHLQLKPGNETPVINGLLAAMLDLDLQGPTRAAGIEAFRRELKQVERGAEMRQAAEWIANANRAAFLIAAGEGQADQLRDRAARFAALAAISGHLGRSGSGVLLLVARNNTRGAWDMGVSPDRLPGHDFLDISRSRQRMEDLWDTKLPVDEGLSAEALLQKASGLIVVADDPPSAVPRRQDAMAAMGRIEFLVALDAFVTPTTRAAHAVLPITAITETDGTFTNIEARVQKLRAAGNPPGEARTGWQVLAELCARFEKGASYGSASDVLREIGQAAPPYAAIVRELSKDGWGGSMLDSSYSPNFVLQPPKFVGGEKLTSDERPYLLMRDGTFEWKRDPLVSYSPTLSRDCRSEQKLFPNGFVEISQDDADLLQLSGGRRAKLSSVHGEAVVSVLVSTEVEPGMLIVPYGFRDRVFNLLGTDALAAVSVQRV